MSDSGGAGGTRTPYLILAKDALSLMSYSPTNLVGGGGPPNREPHNGEQRVSTILRRTEGKEKGPSCLDPDLNRWTVKGNLEFLCEPMLRNDRSTE